MHTHCLADDFFWPIPQVAKQCTKHVAVLYFPLSILLSFQHVLPLVVVGSLLFELFCYNAFEFLYKICQT